MDYEGRYFQDSNTRPRNGQPIHFRGGSFLRTSRANPTKVHQHLATTLSSLQQLGISGLITIGGDDTAFSAFQLEQLGKGGLRVVHVPKTIDNDLCLPHGVSTFGFQTARHLGVEMVKNLMVDARTTSRWYFAVTMGRKAGHLALGIGKAAGATLTLIPEEFRQGKIQLSQLSDMLVGAIVKRPQPGPGRWGRCIGGGIRRSFSIPTNSPTLGESNTMITEISDSLRWILAEC